MSSGRRIHRPTSPANGSHDSSPAPPSSQSIPQSKPPAARIIRSQHDVLRLQQTVGNQAVGRMLAPRGAQAQVQRFPIPAVVTKGTKERPKNAGIHVEDTGRTATANKALTGNVTVKGGGIFGQNLSGRIPSGAPVTVDFQQARDGAGNFVQVNYNGAVGYVKMQYLDLSGPPTQIGASQYWTVPFKSGHFRVFDDTSGQFLTNPIGIAFRADFASMIQELLGAPLPITNIPDVIKDAATQSTAGASPNPALWQQAMQNITTKVIARFNADKAQLVTAGLITNNHQLVSIKMPGADFHKGGQFPMFLNLNVTPPLMPDPRRIVYKPSNLDVDAQLFGRNGLAQALDNAGTQISQYTIIPRTDATSGERYGFMEFVESDLPTNQTDLMGVYRSLAANMAMSYLAGLEDIHQENVLLLKDRIQVIDMEATTGAFKKAQTPTHALNPHEGGFKDMQWPFALLRNGIQQKLFDAASAKTLTSAPPTASVGPAIEAAFKAVLDTAKGTGFNASWNTHKTALDTKQARVVPVPTENFYKLLPVAQQYPNHGAWQTWINSAASDTTINDIIALTKSTAAFTRSVLATQATYDALRRGDIPYYYRDLSTDTVYDEAGTAISAVGFSKKADSIATAMDTRRGELQTAPSGDVANADVFTIFRTQMLPMITRMNDVILDNLNSQH